MRRRWTRALLWLVAVVAFVAAAAYAIGGRTFFRRLLDARSRAVATIQATLQPPTAADLRGSVTDTATAAKTSTEHVSVVFIALTLAGVLGGAVALFYLTGRRR
jgi:hypothetical protein